jgi:type III pantothenate kinase
MQTTLCFDFGNTRLKCAVVHGKKVQEVLVLGSDAVSEAEALVTLYKPSRTILSSVIDHNEEIEYYLAANSRFHKLSAASKINFTTPVGKPETIGADRLALIAGAVHLYPEKHNLVIALGSCITYNFVNRFHQFVGGSISPGLEMRFRAMHEYTAKLPLVKPHNSFPMVAYDTETNMLSGVILGMAKEIDGIIDDYAKKYNFNVLLTGGDMAFFASRLKNRIFAHPYLIYEGLYAISESNQET